MAWDSSRPVPWKRLAREWVIYAAIMSAIFLLFFRDGGVTGPLAGILVSGPLYLLFGAVLAKFGYSRDQVKLRAADRAAASQGSTGSSRSSRRGRSSGDDATESAQRAKPAPTRRTSTGPSNRPQSKKKRKKR